MNTMRNFPLSSQIRGDSRKVIISLLQRCQFA